MPVGKRQRGDMSAAVEVRARFAVLAALPSSPLLVAVASHDWLSHWGTVV